MASKPLTGVTGNAQDVSWSLRLQGWAVQSMSSGPLWFSGLTSLLSLHLTDQLYRATSPNISCPYPEWPRAPGGRLQHQVPLRWHVLQMSPPTASPVPRRPPPSASAMRSHAQPRGSDLSIVKPASLYAKASPQVSAEILLQKSPSRPLQSEHCPSLHDGPLDS